MLAGAGRKGGFCSALKLAARERKVRVSIKLMNIEQGGGRHALTESRRRQELLAEIRNGNFDLVVAIPPGSTFSRATSANALGPKPVRSRLYPRGLPWLKGKQLDRVKAANNMVDFLIKALSAQLDVDNAMAILEHPEDLGSSGRRWDPASIWVWPEVLRLLDKKDTVTGALRQGDIGAASSRPTRLLARLRGVEGIMEIGMPELDSDGNYLGPLKPMRKSDKLALTGKQGNKFVTAQAAAWAPGLCEHLATLAVEAYFNPVNQPMVPLAEGEELDIGITEGEVEDVVAYGEKA